MTRRGKRNVCVGEEFRIATTLALQKFRQTEEPKELEFPSSFTAEERAFIHRLCISLNLKSKSRGKGSNRYLTAYKKEGSTIVQADAGFSMGGLARQHALLLLQKFPVNARERQDLLPPTERERVLGQETRDVNRTTGRLSSGIPQVPPRCENSPLTSFRQSLPIWQYKDLIVAAVAQHQVVLVVGETGCGKTTQVPQYLLERHAEAGQPCRMICTEPRRLATVAVSERIAVERNEKLGQTVGYQIRLENRVSPKTLLTVCTNGILLRTLMGGDASMATVTHVIVDEVHERDRFSDFLLIVLRDLLPKFRNLKVVLMSATVDVQQFVKYFGGCPVIEIPTRTHEVKTYFLEDVLRLTNYMSQAMQNNKVSLQRAQTQKQQLAKWCSESASNSSVAPESGGGGGGGATSVPPGSQQRESLNSSHSKCVEDHAHLTSEMDEALHNAWISGTDEAFSQLLYYIMSENVSVDHQHSETSASALMLAAGRGKVEVLEELLALGASTTARASNDWTAFDWAQHFHQKEAAEVLMANMLTSQCGLSSLEPAVAVSEHDMSEADRDLLDLYHHSFDDDNTDLDLIMCLLQKVHMSSEEGAVLVFLAGYDDIISLKEKILSDNKVFSNDKRYVLYVLHSNIQCSEQRLVFNPTAPGVRKIVLATNIAETSITISDVMFVIDSGKVKEKMYDSLTGTTLLKTTWVSRANAIQRKGRAGRTRPGGVCFHMISRPRFRALALFQQPELLRLPLQELCLQAKLLAPPNVPIADFLARAPDPPAFLVTRAAVTLLKTIDALDPWEELTEMGLHLLDLPIEPNLGKMVLYAVVLKCLDPVLTIVCGLSVKDPFVLPAQPGQKRAAAISRRRFAADTYSDHMALLRAFQGWQKARGDNIEQQFCERHFISASTMATILRVRGQLLGQLRASGFVRARGGGDIRDLNANSDNWAVIKAALCAGSYPNLLRVDRERQQLIAQRACKVRFHTRSTLSHTPNSAHGGNVASRAATVAALPSDWLIYGEMTRVGPAAYAHVCTLVSPLTVALFAGPLRLPLDALHETQHGRLDGLAEESDSEEEEELDIQKSILKLDDWVSFKVEPESGRLALQLRQKLQALFLRRMHAPAKPWSQVDEAVVRSVVGVLTAEEQSQGIPQPPLGIGQRPRPMAPDFGSSPVGSPDSALLEMESRRPIRRPDSGTSPTSSSRGSSAATTPSRGHSEKGTSRCSDERSDTSSLRSGGSGPMSPCFSPGAGWRASGSKRFYVVKAGSQRAVDTSVATGLWSFGPGTDRKLQWALKEGKEVFLVYSVQGSGHFHGYARLLGPASTLQWQADAYGGSSGRCYFIEWCRRFNLPFQSTRHLINAWNENRKVQVSRDGQELEPGVGEALCRLWDDIPQAVPRPQVANR
ncbi:3'-5' RNA helicase YTHDC2-like isoform X2 [Ornithodoros turicata]|uniref:3'-5' RNA helicase YTHDC2-like isoform X2 n=1 Tax=Ornithodoros turicata TaxID=34597 RepID=UPI003138E916